MLRKDILVERPKKTKLFRKGKFVYVYHVTGSNYKKDKQYVVEDRVCIGKMADEKNMFPNDNYYQYYDVEEEDRIAAPSISDTLQIGAPVLLYKIMDDLKISDLLKAIHGEKDANLIKDIISYMIIRETSVMQHFADFSWSHLSKSSKKWDDSKISEFFRNKIQYAQTERFVYAWNALQPEHTDIYISYDSTNMNTRADGVDMAEFGHAKDDKDVPQVNLSYAVKHDDATPLFYELYPGSIIDNTQCTNMIDRAKEYGYRNVGLILDRGYFSVKNIQYFDDNGYDFLMMIKKNSTLVSDKIKQARLPLLTKGIYYLPEHKIYGLTMHGTIGNDLLVRYFHIYYDCLRADQEKMEYLDQLLNQERHLQKKIDEKLHRREEMVSYEKFFKLKYDDYGYLQSYKRNEVAIQKELDKLGFFVIVTSKEMDASEALDIYRKRDSIEKIFRMLKTGLEYDTLRVHSQNSLESKTYVMFIASIVRNYLFQGLKKIKLNEKDKKSYTVPAAISELEKVIVTKNNNGIFIRRYGLTKKQKKIFTQFGVTNSFINKILSDINEKL